MYELLPDIVGEALSVILLTIVSGAFTVAGLLGERAALSALLAGQTALGAWELVMGGTALFAGIYLLGYLQLVPRLRSLLGTDTRTS